MRTPTEIFEEVLDAWDERERREILESLPTLPTPAEFADQECEMAAHAAQVAAYREEFRQSLAVHPGGLPPVPRCVFLVWTGDQPDPQTTCGAPAPNYVSRSDRLPMCDQHAAGAIRVTPWSPTVAYVHEDGPLDADVVKISTASAEEAFQGTCPPLPSREPFFMSSEGIAKVEAPAAEIPTQAFGEIARTALLGADFLRAGQALKDIQAPDDDEFRRRRDASAERYTKEDGSRR